MNLIAMLIMLIVLIFSAIIHEISHGFVAERLGDPTARLMGRLTLNPKNHIDPIMSIALPLLLIISGSPVIFGAAKPVPVDPFNLREGRKDVAIVSLAGPLSNIIVAIIAALLIRVLFFAAASVESGTALGLTVLIVHYVLSVIVQINLLLAIFNLIPIPPLDGSKVFALLLPEKEARIYLAFSSVGFLIIFMLLLFPIGGLSLSNLIYSLLTFAQRLLGV
jgi:Zn-dependent protease